MDSLLRRDSGSESVHLVLCHALTGAIKFITVDLVFSVSATVSCDATARSLRLLVDNVSTVGLLWAVGDPHERAP